MPNGDTPYSMIAGQNQQLFIAATNWTSGASTLYGEAHGGGLEWSSPGQYNLDISTEDGGATATLASGAGSLDLTSFDTSGNQTTQAVGVSAPWYSWTEGWFGISSSGALESVFATPLAISNDNYQSQPYGNSSTTGAGVNNPWFPPLPSCNDPSLGISCPGPYESIWSAVGALMTLTQNTCANCVNFVFDPLKAFYNTGTGDQERFYNFISDAPGLYDGTKSKMPLKLICTYSTWSLEGNICSYENRNSKLTVSDDFNSSPGTEAESQMPAAHGPLVFFRPSSICPATASATTGTFNKSLLFHESLHGFYGDDDATLKLDFGIDQPPPQTSAITTYIIHNVFDKLAGTCAN